MLIPKNKHESLGKNPRFYARKAIGQTTRLTQLILSFFFLQISPTFPKTSRSCGRCRSQISAATRSRGCRPASANSEPLPSSGSTICRSPVCLRTLAGEKYYELQFGTTIRDSQLCFAWNMWIIPVNTSVLPVLLRIYITDNELQHISYDQQQNENCKAQIKSDQIIGG